MVNGIGATDRCLHRTVLIAIVYIFVNRLHGRQHPITPVVRGERYATRYHLTFGEKGARQINLHWRHWLTGERHLDQGRAGRLSDNGIARFEDDSGYVFALDGDGKLGHRHVVIMAVAAADHCLDNTGLIAVNNIIINNVDRYSDTCAPVLGIQHNRRLDAALCRVTTGQANGHAAFRLAG